MLGGVEGGRGVGACHYRAMMFSCVMFRWSMLLTMTLAWVA
jgi:hypothetical protein